MWHPGWRSKAALQHLFSAVPGGDRANYVLQRHLTHTYPVSDASLESDLQLGRHHTDVFARHGIGSLGDARLFEFGAGWDLAMPLVLSRLGARHQVVIDLRPLAREDLVFDIARRLGLGRPTSGALDDLLRSRGIEYRAPVDARATGLRAGSIDLITSTNTLEHIPADDIGLILEECHRILSPTGIMSFQVDYKDHYSYFDRRIPTFHFLRYSPRHWRLFNPALHHQNRLRHADHMAHFHTAGFEVVEEHVVEGSHGDVACIESLPPHPTFANRTLAELAIREARVVLVKRAPCGGG